MQCPYCAETIKDEAIKCKHCGEWLNQSKANLDFSLSGIKEKLSNTRTHLFGSDEMVLPTDKAPLAVDQHLVLYESVFSFKNQKISYDNIYSITYRSSDSSFNFVRSLDTSISLKCRELPNPINVESFSMFVTGKKNKLLRNAHAILSQKSFSSRLQHYLEQINKNGFIDYPGKVKIHANGLLSVKQKSINLKEAYKKGNVGYSLYSRGISSVNYSDDPFAIVASMGSGGYFSSKVYFSAYADNDVIRAIVQRIAETD